MVYCDESCLTSKLLPSHGWMNKNTNIEIDDKKLNSKTLAFVVALSEDKGLVLVDTYQRSLDQYDFIKFLKKVRGCYGSEKIALYLDNASFHTARSVR